MDHKEMVRRFVDEEVNGGRDEVIDELFTDIAGWLREWFGAFRRCIWSCLSSRRAIVSWASLACSGMHMGDWRGHPPTGRRFERVDEVYFFAFVGELISAAWGIEDTLERFRQLGLEPTGG